MTNVITTQQAADELGMSQQALLAFLHRNPDLRPSTKVGQVHLWTNGEIAAIRERRIELRKRPNLDAINAERKASRSDESD